MKDQEQTLLDFYRNLSEQDAQTLLRFAEFLATGAASAIVEPAGTSNDEGIPVPVLIEPPANEKVVAALKRLSKSYPMLEKKKLLDKASSLVSQHVMFGQPAEVVISQIETLFKETYEKFVEETKG